MWNRNEIIARWNRDGIMHAREIESLDVESRWNHARKRDRVARCGIAMESLRDGITMESLCDHYGIIIGAVWDHSGAENYEIRGRCFS